MLVGQCRGRYIDCTMQRTLIAFCCALVGVGALCSAQASEYPTRPIRMILPFAAGGGVDAVARIVAPHLSDLLGQPVIVDNRAGGGATIGTELAARSAADGYTLIVASSTALSVNPVLMPVRYDPLKDFVAITMLGEQPHVLVVNAALPAKSVREFVALAKTRPLDYSSSGNGGPTHLGGELFRIATGTQLRHIPYKGQSAGIIAVLSGEVQFSMPSAASVVQQIRSGKLRALGVTSAKRLDITPELPTMIEEGYPIEVVSWMGLFAPTGTPPGIVTTLHRQVAAMMRQPEVVKKFAAIGVTRGGNPPQEFAAFVRADVKKWARVIKEAGIRLH